MFHKFEGWDKAPKGTTHFCVQDCASPWLKVDEDGKLFYHNFEWRPYFNNEGFAKNHEHMEGAIERPKEVVVKPYTRGLMTLEQLKLMKAYRQIVAFVKLNHKGKFFEETVEAVCQRYLYNFNKLKAHRVENVRQKNYDIMSSFVWSDTREGKGYWIAIHHCERYEVLPLVKPEKEPKVPAVKEALVKKVEAPKKKKEYQPLKAGDVLTAENLRNTEAYAQIKSFIERNNGTPAQQGKLVKMFLAEFNRQKDWPCKDIAFPGLFYESFNHNNMVNQAFCWRDSVDGNGFWTTVNATHKVNLKDFLNGAKAGPAGAPIVPPAPAMERKVEVPEPPKEMPKAPEVKKPAAKVGWW